MKRLRKSASVANQRQFSTAFIRLLAVGAEGRSQVTNLLHPFASALPRFDAMSCGCARWSDAVARVARGPASEFAESAKRRGSWTATSARGHRVAEDGRVS